MKRLALLLALAVASSTLVGCSASPVDDENILIVASTNVYGSIASTVAGDHARVVSIITGPNQDPHSFEADARVQLDLSRADIVIENGGGYDDFVGTLLAGAGNAKAHVITAATLPGSPFDSADPDANEHVWYDLPTMAELADAIAEALATVDETHAADYRANAVGFRGSITGLEGEVAAIAAEHSGENVAITEPVPLYLLEAAGLTNVTPPAFSDAIEEGNGIPPAVLQRMLLLFASAAEDDRVRALVYNEQTSGPETERVLDAARQNGVPVVPVTETLPADTDYFEWMSATIQALAAALK